VSAGPAGPLYAGIDIGAITAKAALFTLSGELVTALVAPAGYNRAQAAEEILARALLATGLERTRPARLVATGYGRVQVPGADRSVTEITCHARGAHWLCAQTGTVIDIGGQDSKAIAVGPDGKVLDFVMNDKCAAGTGRFLEVMARALEVDLDQFGALSVRAPRRAKISSTCTVFAESEVISLIAHGVPVPSILRGLHRSLIKRIVAMVRTVGLAPPLMLSGGVVRNPAVRHMLASETGQPVTMPRHPQLMGAYGAALLALEIDVP
jgi:predicted CoA-substrate-specific enzyme activase